MPRIPTHIQMKQDYHDFKKDQVIPVYGVVLAGGTVFYETFPQAEPEYDLVEGFYAIPLYDLPADGD